MADTSTPRAPLGASTTNRKWYLDVNTAAAGAASPLWVPVSGVTDFKPDRSANTQDDSDFDSGGFGSMTKTGEDWSITVKLARKVTTASATAYDPGQEFLRQHSQGKFGVANSVNVRYYEMEPGGPRVEAYQGRCAVEWTDDGGNNTALSTVTCKMDGQGALVAIAHPAGP